MCSAQRNCFLNDLRDTTEILSKESFCNVWNPAGCRIHTAICAVVWHMEKRWIIESVSPKHGKRTRLQNFKTLYIIHNPNINKPIKKTGASHQLKKNQSTPEYFYSFQKSIAH